MFTGKEVKQCKSTNEQPKIKVKNPHLSTSKERLIEEVKQAKEREAALRKQQEEERLANEKFEKELNQKPRVIYDPSKLHEKETKADTGSKDKKPEVKKQKIKKEDKKTSDPIWQQPTPIEVANLIKNETDKGRVKRGLPIESTEVDKEIKEKQKKGPAVKTKKPSKKNQKSVIKITLKSWQRPPVIPVKGAEKEIKRGEEIRKANEPPSDDEELPGIKGFKKRDETDDKKNKEIKKKSKSDTGFHKRDRSAAQIELRPSNSNVK